MVACVKVEGEIHIKWQIKMCNCAKCSLYGRNVLYYLRKYGGPYIVWLAIKYLRTCLIIQFISIICDYFTIIIYYELRICANGSVGVDAKKYLIRICDLSI